MHKIAGIALLLASAAPAFSQPLDRGPTPGLGWGPGGKPKPTIGVPGPVAGVGLPVLAAGGGVMWVRSRKRRQRAPE